MRLSIEEVNAIKKVVARLDITAKVYLFGSRVYEDQRGGDIDLLIFSNRLSQKDASEIRYNLWHHIGEQKIDIIVAKDRSHPFTRIALKEAILL